MVLMGSLAGRWPLPVALCAACGSWVAAVRTSAPEDLVQVLAGTDATDWTSTSDGNVLPVVKRPHGFNDWAPQTAGAGGSWWFYRASNSFEGMRCTHQPSPWIGDYGYFVVQPHYSDVPGPLIYSPTAATFRPHSFSSRLEEPSGGGPAAQMVLEWTATNRAAMGRVTFKEQGKAGHVSLQLEEGSLQVRDGVITGTATKAAGGVPDGWHGMFFVVKVSPAPSASGTYGTVATLTFPSDVREVVLSLATSFISPEQAELNLKELGSHSFDEVLEEGRQEWRAMLQRVDVDMPTDERLSVFYTNLWRANLFPRYLQEIDPHGMEVHYSPYTKKVESGKLVADSGFWDAYRTVYVLQSIINPTNLGSLAQGWIRAYQEAGWLPTWASPGQRSSMVGTMGDFVLADVIVKHSWGIVTGFNVTGAYEAIRKDAFEPPEAPFGRAGLQDYITKGYVPESEFDYNSGSKGQPESVSRTMNYYLSDAAIARAAQVLGHTADHDTLVQRSLRYKVLFNPESKFFQPKDDAGNFLGPFDPLAWRAGFTEAGAWQYRFYVPHDVDGLRELYGGKLCDSINAMLTYTAGDAYHVGGYGQIIHEMRELADIQADFGLYAHGNQPVHHVLWVAKKAGCDAVADKYLRKATAKLYTQRGWVGDEDNGEMAAWYVLSALGIYALEGGKDEMIIGSPSVSGASVSLPGGRKFTITVQNQGEDNVYVDHVTWAAEGQHHTILKKNVIPYTSLMEGGTLTFTMRSTPKTSSVIT